MKFIDFFSGIGTIRLGMEQAGHDCVGFCEFDKYAVASYTSMHLITEEQRAYLATLPLKQRQKEILNEKYRNGEWFASDIRDVSAGDIPRADIWCFGSPCQSFSIAGLREGMDGKSGLIQEIFRLLRETEECDRPRWLVYENVKGMLSSNRGFDFLKVLTEMDEVGYDAEWQLIDSQYFGVPQHRERVFTVGHSRRFGGRKILPVGTGCEEISVEERYEDLCANTITNVDKLLHGIYPIVGTEAATDRQTDRHSNRPPNITAVDDPEGERFPSIIQVGNFMSTRSRANPNQGRVYSIKGISPCLTNLSQGGGRVPWIIY